MSERYGPWKTCHERLRRWTADGTWDGILAAAQVYDDAQPVEWVISVDSSIVRAHQHSAGARKKGSTGIGRGADPAVGAQIGEAIGRSRGGLSTKIHLAVDGPGRPLSILLTPGQAGDNPQLLPVLDRIRIGRPGPGAPRKRPDTRPPTFDKVLYKRRNVVERCFNRFKQWRDLATRFAKRAAIYHASLVLIGAVMWLP